MNLSHNLILKLRLRYQIYPVLLVDNIINHLVSCCPCVCMLRGFWNTSSKSWDFQSAEISDRAKCGNRGYFGQSIGHIFFLPLTYSVPISHAWIFLTCFCCCLYNFCTRKYFILLQFVLITIFYLLDTI